jgi:hypothetical protein
MYHEEADQIPKDAYILCVQHTFKSLEKYFKDADRVCNNFKMGLYNFPSETEPVYFKYNNLKMQLTKHLDDPFDVAYYLNFKMKLDAFSKPLERCLSLNNIEFKFDNYKYKMDLLDDFVDLIKLKYKLKPKVKIENQYILYKITVMKFVKTERIVVDLI